MQANILVVDDESEIADLVDVYLRSEGFAVRKAATVAQALQLVAQQEPDLALLDVMLPDGDGFSLCSRNSTTSGGCITAQSQNQQIRFTVTLPAP